MKKKYSAAACLSIILILFSCAGQSAPNFFPIPDSGIKKNTEVFVTGNIIETKNGAAEMMPVWLRSFLDGGIEAVEKLDTYSNKYVFIGIYEGENITALNKLMEYYTITHDFPMLAAARIDKRMYLTASLYPDDEYGQFYAAMMHNAYSTFYNGAEKEDVYWIKTKPENGNTEEPAENYVFFLLITIEKRTMQSIIRNMIARTGAAVTMDTNNITAGQMTASQMTPNQSNSVNRLRNTFFEGF
jgi:hypothetical protein